MSKINESHLYHHQREMRVAFYGGFAGQLISGVLWLIASLLSVINSPQAGMLFLFFGCMGIFPLTQLLLRLMGRSGKVKPENGLWALGSQVAFMVPINFILVGAIILFRPLWFFPAAMIIVGSHYLAFVTLYGMKMYAVLAALMVVIGLTIGLYGPEIFSLGGWITSALLILFAMLARFSVLKEERQ